jgi:FkbM family methyltransferase
MEKILDYLPPWLVDLKKKKIILPPMIKRVRLDVGLSDNAPMSKQWIAEDAERELMVIGFEPHPGSRKTLQAGASRWPIVISPQEIGKRLIILPFALQSKKEYGEAKFYLTKNDSGCSSLFRPKTIPIDGETVVETCSLAQFFDLFPFESIPFIEYLKIDAQGADFEIIQGAGGYLQNIAVVTLEAEENEYPEAANQLTVTKEFMTQNNFLFVENLDCTDPTFVNRLYYDMVLSGSIRPFQKG